MEPATRRLRPLLAGIIVASGLAVIYFDESGAALAGLKLSLLARIVFAAAAAAFIALRLYAYWRAHRGGLS